MDVVNITVWLALGAGFLSFISPCMLPLYPSYLSYITGVSTKDLAGNKGMFQRRAMLHTVFFLIGFSIIFFALGLSASLLGDFFSTYQDIIRQLGAIFIISMGLFMLGIFQPRLLMKEKRFELKTRPSGYLGSVLVGITYAAGWTPCIGPIFSAILALGATNPEQSLIYVLAYTLGFAIPFFLMAFFIGRIKWINQYSQRLMKIGGAVMVVMGILLYTDKMTEITIWLIRLYGGFSGF
ncbi:cytochrome c biogenesis protein CcdA [Paenibacillus antri]|uniref:Cytochrome c biogenesis protein CcdA n=1 Tax=Paenibacillus antri TaxID=2582848 RepID=A0A5R9G7X1_9BACL|nr:cytochrome c biogenesis protein CcdA [Paenibacillus antri]TLS52512.1 cytochrome c biogenesis protein CcdA [Paenibacillus antri]